MVCFIYFLIADFNTDHAWLYGIYNTSLEAMKELPSAEEISKSVSLWVYEVPFLNHVDLSRINES